MTTYKILGIGDLRMRELKQNLDSVLAQMSNHEVVVEQFDGSQQSEENVDNLPALLVDGEVLTRGNVPTVVELEELLRPYRKKSGSFSNISSILVPVDLSPASENALAFACQLSHKLNASIDVIYVMDSIFQGSRPSHSGFLSAYRNTMQEELNQFVQTVFEKHTNPCPPARIITAKPGKSQDLDGHELQTKIVFGFAEDAICESSNETDLIVMGTTGRGNLSRQLFGSVSIAVSKNANSPVLLVPPQASFSDFKEIVYASNFESLQEDVIRDTIEFANRFDSRIHFVHVGTHENQLANLGDRLRETLGRVSKTDKPFIFKGVEGDDVVELLHEYAFVNRADLFIFVTHQRSFWESILHKSMSKEMLLHASAPVLVFHSSEAE